MGRIGLFSDRNWICVLMPAFIVLISKRLCALRTAVAPVRGVWGGGANVSARLGPLLREWEA